MENTYLESCANSVIRIRTSLEVMELFPSLGRDMEQIADEERLNLANLLRGVIASPPQNLNEKFHKAAVRIANDGVLRSALDYLLKINLFMCPTLVGDRNKVDNVIFIYRFVRHVSPLSLIGLTPAGLFQALVSDVLECAETIANFVDKRPFDRQVAQRFYAVVYAYLAGTDPWFYSRGSDIPPDTGGWPDGGVGVPRRPVPPVLIGSAAKALPRDGEDDNSF